MSLSKVPMRHLLAGVAFMGCMQAASGVSLSPRGIGQVLLFPYYTVNANNNTLISIVNTTAQGKAVRVRFAEGENGRDAFSLNVYLGWYDTWTAAIGPTIDQLPSNDGGSVVATLVTNDQTCTVPAIPATGVQFSTATFSGANADPGDAGDSRTTEGTIEVIEMGSVSDNSPTETAFLSGQGCAAFVNAWSPGGYWVENPNGGILNPTGGLYGTGYIVNVEQGTIFSYAATAIEAFRADPADQPRGSTSSVVLHTAPGATHPNLADALSDPQQNIAVAKVFDGDATFTATYPAPAQAVDAVSAVLTASVLSNDFSSTSSEGASTNYILSYPTRRFYTDPAIVGSTAISPFRALFAGIQQYAEVESVPLLAFDREGNTPGFGCPFHGCDYSIFTSETSVEVLNFDVDANAFLGSRLRGSPGLELGGYAGPVRLDSFPTEGFTSLYFDPLQFPFDGYAGNFAARFLRPSIERIEFAGLPVIGFATQNLVNSNVHNGVLANYSSAVAHRVTTNCYMPLNDNLQPVPCK